MLSPLAAYELQLELECKQLLGTGRLREVPCDNPDGLGAVSVVRFPNRGDDGEIHLHEDAAIDVEAMIDGMSALDLLQASDDALVRRGLRRNFSGRTGVFDTAPTAASCVGVSEDQGSFFTIMDGTHRAAVAFSARESAHAAELSVETDERFRRQGHARRVAAAWARNVVTGGRTAFYSYDFSNIASMRLAESLGVSILFEAGSFDPL